MKSKENFKKHGFTQAPLSTNISSGDSKTVVPIKVTQKTQLVKSGAGFTLIELLVVIAIIALLSSVALIAASSAQQKGRDAKRLSDMAQMNTALGLYFSDFRGYPNSTSGIPSLLAPTYASSLPSSPQPPDGSCAAITYSTPLSAGISAGSYYYYPSGTTYLGADGSTMVAPDYAYYFCLGNQTGEFAPKNY